MPRCSLMSMGTPVFISKLKFSYDKYSVDKVWTKIYCHFYFRGITLKENVEQTIWTERSCVYFDETAIVESLIDKTAWFKNSRMPT